MSPTSAEVARTLVRGRLPGLLRVAGWPQPLAVQQGPATEEVDVEAFMAADPDPLHPDERDLLVDLARNHRAEVEEFFCRVLNVGGSPKAVRLDRYGITVDTGRTPKERFRLEFTRPVRDRRDLARVLHPVLFPRCPGHCQNRSFGYER